jgi:Lrp/AsnC family leucine-responsive transcriptional regulator
MASSSERLDDIDIKILRLLQQNARLTLKEIGSQVNLSSTPVYERFRRLEREGYIKKYVAVLDEEKLNMGLTVYCSVKLKQQTLEQSEMFAKVISEIREVTECYNISGQNDFLLKIQAANMAAYREFVLHVLGAMDQVWSYESTFVMDTVKHDYGLTI